VEKKIDELEKKLAAIDIPPALRASATDGALYVTRREFDLLSTELQALMTRRQKETSDKLLSAASSAVSDTIKTTPLLTPGKVSTAQQINPDSHLTSSFATTFAAQLKEKQQQQLGLLTTQLADALGQQVDNIASAMERKVESQLRDLRDSLDSQLRAISDEYQRVNGLVKEGITLPHATLRSHANLAFWAFFFFVQVCLPFRFLHLLSFFFPFFFALFSHYSIPVPRHLRFRGIPAVQEDNFEQEPFLILRLFPSCPLAFRLFLIALHSLTRYGRTM
jgi:hypothetical protein